jgi:hypothetical protein
MDKSTGKPIYTNHNTTIGTLMDKSTVQPSDTDHFCNVRNGSIEAFLITINVTGKYFCGSKYILHLFDSKSVWACITNEILLNRRLH